MQIIYEQNWREGTGGWTNAASKAAVGSTTPTRIQVAHPLAEYAIQFSGNGGWAIGAKEAPIKTGTLEIRFQAYICAAGRNSLSLNVRDEHGNPVYKYSLGEGNRIWANKQPVPGGEPGQKQTALVYACHVPYELISRHTVGSGIFTLSIRNLTSGQVRDDVTEWACRSKAAPAQLDFDQEDGDATAFLGRVEVWEL